MARTKKSAKRAKRDESEAIDLTEKEAPDDAVPRYELSVEMRQGYSLNYTKWVIAKDGRQSFSDAIVFLHGWSGSGAYYKLAIDAMLREENKQKLQAQGFGVLIALDMRGHGRNEKPCAPCHVSKLAADLQEIFLDHCGNEDADYSSIDEDEKIYFVNGKVLLVGSSMGAAVIWSLSELFGLQEGDCHMVKSIGVATRGAVFVDQAPLQYETDGWKDGSKGMRGPDDLKALRKVLNGSAADFDAFADENAAACLANKESVSPEVLAMLKAETLKCDPYFLGELMADHTAIDWREYLELGWPITCPVLNIAGGKSEIFPQNGVKAVADLIKAGDHPYVTPKVMENSGHW